MEKTYAAKKFEDDIYNEWLNSGYFNPDNLPNRNKKTFSIILPPPNVTGQLHIGHAAMLAYQDLIVRYHRLKGDQTLWLPGMDHASIATQTVVDKKLKKQGIDRHQIGRTKFLKEIDKFVTNSKTIIKKQLQKIGSSLDWSRERYTLDQNSSQAVQEAFLQMYHDGLIYRGKRVVNWCPHCQSTLADDEVEHQTQNTKLYYFKYDQNFPITIATSRPETKLGDTAIAVNPKDKRYQKYIGQTLKANFCGIQLNLKVIADRNVDLNFGTGALGVTPAHSIIDYEMALKNNLQIKEVIDIHGKIKKGFGKFSGLDVKIASQKIIQELKQNKLLEKEEDYQNNLAICYRCHNSIEPLPLKQWFVNVNQKIKKRGNKTLKQLASEIVKKGEIKIIPERFNKIYFQWMNNLKDWCISRQIWFGHQIPVWYQGEKVIVPKTITKFSFMRHGLTDWNKEKRIQGQKDIPLDEQSIERIKTLIPQIEKEKFDLIICSPLKRARQTAEILNTKLKLKIEIEELITEKNFGIFEGLKKDKKFKKNYPQYLADKLNYDIPGPKDESGKEVLARIEKFFQKTLRQHADQKILVICHGTLIRYVRALMVNESPQELSTYPVHFDKLVNFTIPDNHYRLRELKRDSDTLDTWFSSGLWTFSTLGWPQKTSDLKRFHPTSVMETGYDILFFWVARMILMSTYLLNTKPFDTVYLHGLVRDKQGRKMSKSLGNGIDPLEMIKKYGADSLRLSMIIGSTPGTDMKLYDEKVASYRNFVNKLWNISRYILTTVKKVKLVNEKPSAKTLADKWILNELEQIIFKTTKKIEQFQFSSAGEDLYDFTWNKLADWYLEISKIENDKDEILLYILQNLLKLWHPFTPYVTEVIWKNFKQDLLLVQKWPVAKKQVLNVSVSKKFQIIKNIIVEIRKFKNTNKIDPAKFIKCHLESKKYASLLKKQREIISKLARVEIIQNTNELKEKISLAQIDIYLEFKVDKKLLAKEKENLEKYIKVLQKKLDNKNFVKNAPAKIVQQEKKKLIEAQKLLKKITV